MGKHYSEATERAGRLLFWSGLGLVVVAVLIGALWRDMTVWILVGISGLLGLSVAMWNRPRRGMSRGTAPSSLTAGTIDGSGGPGAAPAAEILPEPDADQGADQGADLDTASDIVEVAPTSGASTR